MEEEDRQIRSIMVCNLPYFMFELNYKFPDGVKKGIFKDIVVIGCSFDFNYDICGSIADIIFEQKNKIQLFQ